MFTVSTDTIELQRHQWEVTTRETGPNDFGRVVWALGDIFFYHLCFLSLLKYINGSYRFYRSYRDTERVSGGCYDVNGPKRPLTCRLGSR